MTILLRPCMPRITVCVCYSSSRRGMRLPASLLSRMVSQSVLYLGAMIVLTALTVHGRRRVCRKVYHLQEILLITGVVKSGQSHPPGQSRFSLSTTTAHSGDGRSATCMANPPPGRWHMIWYILITIRRLASRLLPPKTLVISRLVQLSYDSFGLRILRRVVQRLT